MPRHPRVFGRLCVGAAVVVAAALEPRPTSTSAPPQGAPVFRTGTDLIAVDVQVIARSGSPVPDLTADRFEVSINGRRRRLVSVALVRYEREGRTTTGTMGSSGAVARADQAPEDSRSFVLALDTASVRPDGMREVVSAARRFVERLHPSDRAGLWAIPGGVVVDPTTEHGAVLERLDEVVGTGEPPVSAANRYRILPSQVVDITVARQRDPSVPIRDPPPNTALGRTVRQFCAFDRDPEQCRLWLVSDAEKLAMYEEALALQRVGAFRALLARLAEFPGRKHVVLVSGGLLQTDLPGGRPDLGDLSLLAGKEAARANATVWALHVDTARATLASAESGGAPRPIDNVQRDSAILARPLDQLAGPSGGRLFTVAQGGGDPAFARILDETSTYYLLGVEPAEADRDDQPRRLTVTVKGLARGSVVRSRGWVVVPRQARATPVATATRPAPPVATAPVAVAPVARGTSEAAVPAARASTAFDDLYAAYASGDTSVVTERLRSREDFERHRPDLLRALSAWRQSWAPRRAAFALEVAIAAIAQHWPNPRDFVRMAREIVTARPDAPGSRMADDRFELLFHRVAVATLAAVNAPEEVEAYLAAIDDRVATDGRAATAARLFDGRLLLARAMAREQLALLASSRRARQEGRPWSWLDAPGARDDRAALAQVLELLRAAAVAGEASDQAMRDEAAVREAFVLYRLGRHTEAVDLLAATPPGTDAVVACWRALVTGRALAVSDRLEAASAALEEAARLAPGAQTPAVALATVRLKLGDRAGALRWAAVARSGQDALDPWTLYWTADGRFVPAWLAELRRGRP